MLATARPMRPLRSNRGPISAVKPKAFHGGKLPPTPTGVSKGKRIVPASVEDGNTSNLNRKDFGAPGALNEDGTFE